MLNQYIAAIPEINQDWISIAKAYTLLNDFPNAYTYMLKYQINSDVKQNVRFYALMSQIYEKDGFPNKALEAYQHYSRITDSINLATYGQTTLFMEECHKFELQTIKEKEKTERITFLSIIIILILTSICVWIHIRLHINTVEKKHLENENEKYRLQLLGIEEERNNLTQLLSTQKEELSEAAQTALMERLALLNRFFTAYITNSNASAGKLHKEIEMLITDRDAFINSNRLSFSGSHPKFIQYLEEKGLNQWEINYCCLYALGLNGKEIGTYIKMRSHYNQSSLIRDKLGISEHDTNLGIYLRKLLKEVPME